MDIEKLRLYKKKGINCYAARINGFTAKKVLKILYGCSKRSTRLDRKYTKAMDNMDHVGVMEIAEKNLLKVYSYLLDREDARYTEIMEDLSLSKTAVKTSLRNLMEKKAVIHHPISHTMALYEAMKLTQ